MLIIRLWGVVLENKTAEIVIIFAHLYFSLELQNIISNEAKNIICDMYTCVLYG